MLKYFKSVTIYPLYFFTEYYQFYILDSETTASTDANDFWSPEAERLRLAISEGLLGVTVAKYAKIKVSFKVLKKSPSLKTKADHIVETSLNIPSGHLEIRDCSAYDIILGLDLQKTNYQIRVSSFKLDTVQNDSGKDYYVVEIWPGKIQETKLIKKWQKIV